MPEPEDPTEPPEGPPTEPIDMGALMESDTLDDGHGEPEGEQEPT